MQEVIEDRRIPLLSSWLRSNPEDLIDEGDLSHDIASIRTLNLTLANHIHRLIPFECPSGRIERAKP